MKTNQDYQRVLGVKLVDELVSQVRKEIVSFVWGKNIYVEIVDKEGYLFVEYEDESINLDFFDNVPLNEEIKIVRFYGINVFNPSKKLHDLFVKCYNIVEGF